MRRKFFELHEAGSAVAKEAIRRIGELYEIEIEREIRRDRNISPA